MRFWKLMLRLSLLVALHLTANAAHATPPFGCAPGNQDNTCLTAIRSAPIPQPACSTAAGWTTAAAAVWIGSRWSQPQCNFQPAPTCPPNFDQTAAPMWNGSSWVGLACTPRAVTPSLPILLANCRSSINAQLAQTNLSGSPLARWTGNSFDEGPYDGAAGQLPGLALPFSGPVMASDDVSILIPAVVQGGSFYNTNFTPGEVAGNLMVQAEAFSNDDNLARVAWFFCLINPNTGAVIDSKQNGSPVFPNN
jgi:hypothetical protein